MASRMGAPGHHDAEVTAPRGGVLRLVAGMVRVNHPATLPTGLAHSLAGGLVGTAVGVLSPSIWALADSMAPWRLAVTVTGAITLHAGWRIVAPELWEWRRGPQRCDRPGIGLRNAATVLTVVLGVATFTAVLFLLALTTLSVLVTPQHLGTQLGHPVGPVDYLDPALLAAVLGTVVGAIGSGRAPTRRSRPHPGHGPR